MMGTFSEYRDLTVGYNNKSKESVSNSSEQTCPNCGNKINVDNKFCGSCGCEITNNVSSSEMIDNHNAVNLTDSNATVSNLKKRYDNDRKDSNVGVDSVMLLAELELKQYDMDIKKVRRFSFKSLIVLALIVYVLVECFVMLPNAKDLAYYYGYDVSLGSIVYEGIMCTIGVLIIWAIVFGVQWYNRHKMANKLNINLIRLMYFIPHIPVIVCFFNIT